jgi:hypothetical protein
MNEILQLVRRYPIHRALDLEGAWHLARHVINSLASPKPSFGPSGSSSLVMIDCRDWYGMTTTYNRAMKLVIAYIESTRQ